MCEVFMGLFEELRMSKIGQSVRVTVAYSDTFPVSRGCHCNQLNLYNILSFDNDNTLDNHIKI